MWVSDVLPGNVNDLSAARELVLAALGPFTAKCPCWPTAGTKAQVTASSPP